MIGESRVSGFFRSPAGRVAGATLGLVAIGWLLSREDTDAVAEALSLAAFYFPSVLLLEVAILACSVLALRELYHEDRDRLPARVLFRAGWIGYSAMGLLPAGRTAAEAVRAALLSRYASGAMATAAAVRMQGVALLGNAVISLPATFAMLAATGVSLPTALIAGNFALTLTLGLAILLSSHRWRIGGKIVRRFPGVAEYGEAVDQLLARKPLIPGKALGWEILGRVLQVTQYGILVVAVGGAAGLGVALRSEALHLVGAAAGDLIPAQLGATELAFRGLAESLSLRPSLALTIALIAHAAQLICIAFGLLVGITVAVRMPRLTEREAAR